MRLRTLSLLALVLAACAGAPPPPKPAPSGKDWRTLHQGYIAAQVTATSSQQGNYQVTTVDAQAQRKVIENNLGKAEKPRLTAGTVVTPESLQAEETAR